MRPSRYILYFLIFGAVLFALSAFYYRVPAQAACNAAAFFSCRDEFNLQGCIDACPYVPAPCPPGSPPNTECKETDKACSDSCQQRGNAQGEKCMNQSGCSFEEVQTLLRGGSVDQPPTTEQPTLPPADQPVQPPVPESLQQKQAVHTVEDSEFKGETKALVDTKPQKIDKRDIPEPKGDDMGVIASISGEAEVLLPGSDTPIKLSKGDGLPEGAQIFTGDETIVRIGVRGGAAITIDAVSEFTLDKFNVDRTRAQPNFTTRMKLKTGKVEVGIAKGEFTSDMKIATPANTGAVTGTHFAVAYNKTTGVSIFEIYDGTIEVTNNKTGKTIALASSYEKPIKRVEIGKDNKFLYKIAIAAKWY